MLLLPLRERSGPPGTFTVIGVTLLASLALLVTAPRGLQREGLA